MKGCKNCPAYAKCTVSYRGSACAALRSTYGIDRDPEIITNADRIRAKLELDEELAIVLVKYEGTGKRPTPYGGHEHIFYGPQGEKCETREHAVKLWVNWLQQPAKDGT